MAAGTSNYWEDLRKQARQLENELDLKLVSFSKLCTSYSHSSARDGRRDRYSSDTTPLLNGSSQDRMFETMAIEIEQLLARLTGVNDKMAEYTNSAGVPSLNAALMHTLQRHRDIFLFLFNPCIECIYMYLREQREKSSEDKCRAIEICLVLLSFLWCYEILKMSTSSCFCLVELNNICQ
uniref:Golgi SNAP receptor complex member 1 n=1 Tax=Equus asinus asinus TaxID=83772 RepID=A0A8C4PLG0_EQUAS